MLGSCSVEGLARGESFRPCEIEIAIFQSHHIEEFCVRVVRRGEPVRRSNNPGTDMSAFSRGYFAGQYRTSRRVNSRGPCQFLHKWRGAQELAIRPIENREKTRGVSLGEQVAPYPNSPPVPQDRCFIGIVVVYV